MRLVFLYGPHGVGKLSVGSELVALTGFKLFHNHLAVDLVASVFPRESDVYFRLLRRIRRDVFAEATQLGIDLVFTGVYRGTAAQAEAVRTMLEPVWDGGGSVLFVQLMCAREELLRRVQSDARRARGKLTDPEVMMGLMDQYDLFATIPCEPTLRIDSTNLSPTEVAMQIATHYGLPLLPPNERVAREPTTASSGQMTG